jgi:precorrin-2 dehydrogenase/sirohydrochlorin ferrochelatase
MIIDLDLRDKNVLVVGGGNEASKKIKSLLNYKCNITVISKSFNRFILDTEKPSGLKLIYKDFNDIILDKLGSFFIVFATTNNRDINQKIIDWAKDAKILSYSTDNLEKSDFALLSIINIEEIVRIAISTSGKSPIMNKIIKEKIEDPIKNIIGKYYIDNIKIQEFARIWAKRYIEKPKERKDFLYSLINNSEIQKLLNENKFDIAKERIINIAGKLEDNKGR